MNDEVKKCLCNETLCAKCLGINCEDDNCKIHSLGDKIRSKRRILGNLMARGNPSKIEISKYRSEIEKLDNLRKI